MILAMITKSFELLCIVYTKGMSRMKEHEYISALSSYISFIVYKDTKLLIVLCSLN